MGGREAGGRKVTPYFKGALSVLGLIVLGLLALMAFANGNQKSCDIDNYKVYAFKKCINDKNAKCFITPDMIETYSRALEDMDSRECEAWDIEEDEVVVSAPRFNKPPAYSGEEKGA